MDNLFALRWNNYENNISTGFQSLYDSGILVDVTLACDGKLFQAHKMILAICSPYFQEMFGASPCNHPIIVLKDVSSGVMKSILQFMYKGFVNIKYTEFPTFMNVAKLLQIRGLSTMSTQVNPKNTSHQTITDNQKIMSSTNTDNSFTGNQNIKGLKQKDNNLTPVSKKVKISDSFTSPSTSQNLSSFCAERDPLSLDSGLLDYSDFVQSVDDVTVDKEDLNTAQESEMISDEFVDNWTRRQTLALIREIQKYPHLYNPADICYTNKRKRKQSFDLILKEVKKYKDNVTVVAIKKKIRTLHSQLSKENTRFKNFKAQNPDGLYEPKLWCSKELSFLSHCSDSVSSSTSNLDFSEINIEYSEEDGKSPLKLDLS